MPLSKSIIRNRLRNGILVNYGNWLTPTEQHKAVLRGNQLIELFYEIRKDGFFTGISYSQYQKEFTKLCTVQNAIGLLHNKFINVVQPNGSCHLVGLPNNRRFNISGNEIAMILFWSYASVTELTLRLLRKVIDFNKMYKSMFILPETHFNTKNITLAPALRIIESRYKTNAFIDIDIELRNIISHYDFNFFQHRQNAGIEFFYHDLNGTKRCKRYNLKKIMIQGKKVSILLGAMGLTITPSFF